MKLYFALMLQPQHHTKLPPQAAENSEYDDHTSYHPPLHHLLHSFLHSLQGLFSATLNAEVQGLMRAGLRNPVTITVKEKLRGIVSNTCVLGAVF